MIPKLTLGELSTLTRRLPSGSGISTVDGEDIGWTEIEVTVDSGACDTVMPTKLCPHISVLATEDSKRGMEYEVANGETLPNHGERHCLLMTEDSQSPKKIGFGQAAVVNRCHSDSQSVSPVNNSHTCLGNCCAEKVANEVEAS